MKIFIGYSSKTNNTKKVAEAIYEEIKDIYNVEIYNIKKIKKSLTLDYDLYILGAWTDKTTANKKMRDFIDKQKIHNKNVALFLTCGVPANHYHAEDSINNFIDYMKNRKNNIITSFICQGKIDPRIIIVFRFLSLTNKNFIHKVTPEMKEMVALSATHPDENDLFLAKKHFKETINKIYNKRNID